MEVRENGGNDDENGRGRVEDTTGEYPICVRLLAHLLLLLLLLPSSVNSVANIFRYIKSGCFTKWLVLINEIADFLLR
jgi:hypothetical protein